MEHDGRVGEPGSIAALAAELRELVAALPAREAAKGLFASTYSRTTEALGRAVGDGTFLDPDWVEQWDLAFGGYFLTAFEAFVRDRPEALSRPWRLAFSADPELPALRHLLLGVNAHVNYDLPQALLAVISDEDFGDPAVMERRRVDHERVDAILAGQVAGEDRSLKAMGSQRLLDRLLTPLNRLASRRFLREGRRKVWHNAVELQAARVQGPEAYRVRLGELEVLSAAKVADLLEPGQVLLRQAVAGFGVTLPPPLPDGPW
jgi:hypothetical protein